MINQSMVIYYFFDLIFMLFKNYILSNYILKNNNIFRFIFKKPLSCFFSFLKYIKFYFYHFSNAD